MKEDIETAQEIAHLISVVATTRINLKQSGLYTDPALDVAAARLNKALLALAERILGADADGD